MSRIAFVALALTACGPTAASSAAFEQSRSDALLAVQAHQRDAAAVSTTDACLLEHQRYDQLVRPQLETMNQLSSMMGSCRPMHGGAGFGMRKMCGDLMTELDHHASLACTGDAVTVRAEADGHCQRMLAWLSQFDDCAR